MAYVEDRWKGAAGERSGKGRRWRVRYIDPAGKERSRSFDRKLDADRFRSTVETDVLRGSWVDPKAGRITLREYADQWMARQAFEESTRERVEQRFRSHIYPAFGDLSLVQISQSPSAIQSWIQGMPVADNYKRAMFAHLSACLNAAVDDGRITRNPCHAGSVKLPKLVRPKIVPWTGGQVSSVRGALPERYQALCDVGAGLGLRQGEALGLSPDDFEWLRGVVHIRRQVKIVRSKMYFAPPKGGKERDIPLPESVKLRVAAHLARFPAVRVTLPWRDAGGALRTEALIFTSSARRACNRSYIDRRVWKPALEKAGVEPGRKSGFHALRHYFASSLLTRGEDIKTVAEYLGHHDAGFTLRVYAHFIPGNEDRMRRIIDGLLLDTNGPETAQGAAAEES